MDTAFGTHTFTKAFIARYHADGCGHAFDVVWIHVLCCIATYFGERSAVGGDDGTAAGHGFDDGKAEAFVEAREEKGIGCAVEGGEVETGFDVAHAFHAVGEIEFLDKGIDAFGVPSSCANQDEAVGEFSGSGGEGTEESFHIFARFDGTHVEKEGLS